MKTINQIIEWLKANGNDYNGDGSAYAFGVKDEPWMQCDIEWQALPDDMQLLFAGYNSVVNGDLCHDPQFIYTIKEGELTNMRNIHWFTGATDCTTDEEVDWALEFADHVWERHLVHRCNTEAHADADSTVVVE